MDAKYCIAIDPGVSGGIAYILDGTVHATPMPEGMTAIVDALRNLAAIVRGPCIMEKVGTYVPGNGVGSACKFARHCGHLEAALYAVGIPAMQVAPQVWMKKVGELPKGKAERKRALRDFAARRYPHLAVTLRTADALALLAVSV